MGRLARFIRFYTDEDDGNGGEKGVLKTVTGALLHIVDALAKPAKKFTATLEPIQDLHGQDAPYPSGGGKNLLPITLAKLKTLNANGTWTGDTYAYNGITFTFKTLDDYVTEITANGTASARADLGLSDVTLDAGSYIINGCPSGGSTTTYWIGSGMNTYPNDTGSGSSFTLSSDTALRNTDGIRIYAGYQANNLVFRPMIRLSTVSDGAFAPYENICPITGHTGANVVRTGVNLFDKTTAVIGYIDDADGELKGTSASSAYRSTDFVRVDGGKSYYIKTEQTASTWGAWYDENKAFVRGQTNYANAVITAPNNAKYIRLTIVSSASGNVDTFSINYPSTDHDYHAYTGTTIPITFPALGKNLLPTTVYNWAAAGGAIAEKSTYRGMYCKVPSSGDYTISRDVVSGNRFRIFASKTEPAPGVAIRSIGSDNDTALSDTVTVPSDFNYIFIYLSNASDTITSNIQVEAGTTATSYEPYNDTVYGGTLTNEDGEWKLTVDRASETFDGSNDEEWQKHGAGSASAYAMRITIPNIKFVQKGITAWSNYLQSISNDATWGNYDEFMSMHANGIVTGIRTITTVEDWRTYLAQHPLQVVYELATSTTYTLTESQALTLLQGENNIWVDDSDSLELQYYAKAEETP